MTMGEASVAVARSLKPSDDKQGRPVRSRGAPTPKRRQGGSGARSCPRKQKGPPDCGTDHGRITFDQWLQLKNRQAAQRRRQQRRAAQQRRQAQLLRRQMCEQSYADWLRAKRRSLLLKDSRTADLQQLESQSSQRLQLSQLSLAQWQRRKQHERQLQRERQLLDARSQSVRDQLRRQLSKLAWQRWLSRLALKEQRFPLLQRATGADKGPAALTPVSSQ